jgi:hypothetical protein
MSVLTIDLAKNSAIKDLIAAMQPGDPITLRTSIKSKDDQTLQLTVERAEEGEHIADEDEDSDPEAAVDEPEVPAGKAVNEGGNGGRIAAELER